MSRPNILFILCDQLAPQWLDCAHTPHLDALAAEGAVFRHAYCNSPISAPSRASLCTGCQVSSIGAYDNGAEFEGDAPTVMSLLADEGYNAWLSGKMHFIGPDQHHGFQRRLTTDIYPASHVWTPDWNACPVHNPGTAVDQLSLAGLCTWGLQYDYDEETHFRALEALRDLAPTFCDLADASESDQMEGRSLLAPRHEEKNGRGILGEYLSKGVCQPMRYAVRDRLKYVYVHEHPELLFDLDRDPGETENRLNDPAYAGRLEHLRSMVHEGWDPTNLREQVLASQQQRRGRQAENPDPGWDVRPDFDESRLYVRHRNAQATNEERRL